MRYADHRLPYPGDHSIQFEVRDTEKARQQLQHVKLLNKPRARPNELDRRMAAVLPRALVERGVRLVTITWAG
jgi:hypothetical protein